MPKKHETPQPLSAETIVSMYGWSRCNPVESFVDQSSTYPLGSSRVVARLRERDEAGEPVNITMVLKATEPTNPDFDGSIRPVETVADRVTELVVVDPGDPHWEIVTDLILHGGDS